MAQRVYATEADYIAFAEEPSELDPAVLLKRLRSASEEVDSLTLFSRYALDDDGFPTDADVSDAFTAATCAIVEYQAVDNDPTGAEANAGAVKIGSVSLGTTSSRESTADPTEQRIGPKASRILRNAGLISPVIRHL
ncbi:hypothetical protein [Glaciihabitans sp. dw_435]|uniref:hypothetical protein n=1 Tax=Glaciihabitans sp. dw_435 TaxID=2720081 RepID=UPI001BD4CA23|nr:hypothetical protein [Glaciihabitans sp. dw_435]